MSSFDALIRAVLCSDEPFILDFTGDINMLGSANESVFKGMPPAPVSSYTALSLAVALDLPFSVRALLQKNADWLVPDSAGMTPERMLQEASTKEKGWQLLAIHEVIRQHSQSASIATPGTIGKATEISGDILKTYTVFFPSSGSCPYLKTADPIKWEAQCDGVISQYLSAEEWSNFLTDLNVVSSSSITSPPAIAAVPCCACFGTMPMFEWQKRVSAHLDSQNESNTMKKAGLTFCVGQHPETPEFHHPQTTQTRMLYIMFEAVDVPSELSNKPGQQLMSGLPKVFEEQQENKRRENSFQEQRQEDRLREILMYEQRMRQLKEAGGWTHAQKIAHMTQHAGGGGGDEGGGGGDGGGDGGGGGE